MLDGTPVLDIKPYIPHYDNPVTLNQQWNTEKHLGNDIYGSNSELIDHSRIPREAPDGEEEGSPNDLSSAASSMQISEQVCPVTSNLKKSFMKKCPHNFSFILGESTKMDF